MGPLTIDRVKAAVCNYYGVSDDALVSAARNTSISMARSVAMYISRNRTGACLKDIGASFGGRDHTTVMAAVARVRRLIADLDTPTTSAVEAIGLRLDDEVIYASD